MPDSAIEYAIMRSDVFRDRYDRHALNAICRIPGFGRALKVVYKRLSKDKVYIITAFWMD